MSMDISPQAGSNGKTINVAISKDVFDRMGESESKEMALFMMHRMMIEIMKSHDVPIAFYPVESRHSSWLHDDVPSVVYSVRWAVVKYTEAYFAPLPKFPKGANFWERLVFLFTGKVQEEYKYE